MTNQPFPESKLVLLNVAVNGAYRQAQMERAIDSGSPPSNVTDFHWPTVGIDTMAKLDQNFPNSELSKIEFIEALQWSIALSTNEWIQTLKLRN